MLSDIFGVPVSHLAADDDSPESVTPADTDTGEPEEGLESSSATVASTPASRSVRRDLDESIGRRRGDKERPPWGSAIGAMLGKASEGSPRGLLSGGGGPATLPKAASGSVVQGSGGSMTARSRPGSARMPQVAQALAAATSASAGTPRGLVQRRSPAAPAAVAAAAGASAATSPAAMAQSVTYARRGPKEPPTAEEARPLEVKLYSFHSNVGGDTAANATSSSQGSRRAPSPTPAAPAALLPAAILSLLPAMASSIAAAPSGSPSVGPAGPRGSKGRRTLPPGNASNGRMVATNRDQVKPLSFSSGPFVPDPEARVAAGAPKDDLSGLYEQFRSLMRRAETSFSSAETARAGPPPSLLDRLEADRSRAATAIGGSVQPARRPTAPPPRATGPNGMVLSHGNLGTMPKAKSDRR